jgi:hypothetical protein
MPFALRESRRRRAEAIFGPDAVYPFSGIKGPFA